MSPLATLTGTGWIPLGHSLIAMTYTIQVTKNADGLITARGLLQGPHQELTAFIASDGFDLRSGQFQFPEPYSKNELRSRSGC